jgi:hypothetical protein
VGIPRADTFYRCCPKISFVGLWIHGVENGGFKHRFAAISGEPSKSESHPIRGTRAAFPHESRISRRKYLRATLHMVDGHIAWANTRQGTVRIHRFAVPSGRCSTRISHWDPLIHYVTGSTTSGGYATNDLVTRTGHLTFPSPARHQSMKLHTCPVRESVRAFEIPLACWKQFQFCTTTENRVLH